MLIILLLILPLNTLAGQAYQELIKFRDGWIYEPEFDYTVCPWQSFRLQPYLSLQLDLICNQQALRVLQVEPWLFMIDLLDIYHGYPFSFDRLQLIQRWSDAPKKYTVHIPGLPTPYDQYFNIVQASKALDITKNGLNGWYYENSNGKLALAVKSISPGVYQVSAALFLEAKSIQTLMTIAVKSFFLIFH